MTAIVGVTVEYTELNQSKTLLVPRNSTVMYDITYQTWLYKSMTVSMDSVSEHDTVQLAIRHYNHNNNFIINHMKLSKDIASNQDNNKVVRYWPGQVTGKIQYDSTNVKLCYYWKKIDDGLVGDSDEICNANTTVRCVSQDNNIVEHILKMRGPKQSIIFLQFCCLKNNECASVTLNINETFTRPKNDGARDYVFTKANVKKSMVFADFFTELSRSTQLYITETKLSNNDFQPIVMKISYTAGINIIESMVIIVVVLILLTLWMGGVCCCKRVYGTFNVLK